MDDLIYGVSTSIQYLNIAMTTLQAQCQFALGHGRGAVAAGVAGTSEPTRLR